MNTPLYLRRRLLPSGAETVSGSNSRPRPSELAGAPFIAVVFNGNGRVLDFFPGTNTGEASGPALRAYVARQEDWDKLGAAGKARVTDPPMWDLYRWVNGRYIAENRVEAASAPAAAATEPAPTSD